MAYDLAVRCVHQTGVVSVHLHMSTKEIMKLIGLQFNIIEEPFDLQVYDDRFRTYIDFDDEYAEELRQISPRTHRKTLTAEVLFTNTRETENISCYSMFELRLFLLLKTCAFFLSRRCVVAVICASKQSV
jgi:hypothetical protein